MVDVPNLSLVTPKEKARMEGIPPHYRLGRMIRDRRIELEMSVQSLAQLVAQTLNSDFCAISLEQIERGVRPASFDELGVFAGALKLSQAELLKRAEEWNKAMWAEKPERVTLEPAGTQVSTTFCLSPHEMWDELCAVVADLDRGADALYGAARGDVASVESTAGLLQASARRIRSRMASGRVQATCTSEPTEIPPTGTPVC